jgi:ligand-binding sensor domain-containing protein
VQPAAGQKVIEVNGAVWVGGAGTLFRLQAGAAARPVPLGRLRSNDIAAIAVDGHDRAWLGAFDGGVEIVADGGGVQPLDDALLPSLEVNHITVDGTRALISTSKGLAVVDTETLGPLPGPNLTCRHTSSTLVASDGTVWIGTNCGVVAWRQDDGSASLFSVAEGLPHRSVFALAEHRGTLYVGTLDGLASRRIDASPGDRFHGERRLDGGRLPDNWITALLSDGDALWIGTYAGGVQRRVGTGDLAHTALKRINLGALVAMGDGVLVGGLEEGAAVLGQAGGDRRLEPLAGLDVTGFAVGPSSVWAATRSGLVRFATGADSEIVLEGTPALSKPNPLFL